MSCRTRGGGGCPPIRFSIRPSTRPSTSPFHPSPPRRSSRLQIRPQLSPPGLKSALFKFQISPPPPHAPNLPSRQSITPPSIKSARPPCLKFAFQTSNLLSKPYFCPPVSNMTSVALISHQGLKYAPSGWLEIPPCVIQGIGPLDHFQQGIGYR